MAQKLFHYWADRSNTNSYVTDTNNRGKVIPPIDGLDIKYRFTDANGIDCFLSECPDEESSPERYKITNTVGAGLTVVDTPKWNSLISEYDTRQEAQRMVAVRNYRTKLLDQSDWVVSKSNETGVGLSTAFKNWRTSLRDLPTVAISTQLPTAPSEVIGLEGTLEGEYQAELYSVPKVNDGLPAQAPPGP